CRAKGNDWYLPAKNELKLLYRVRDTINRTLKERGGNTLSDDDGYWSSTEDGKFWAWRVNIDSGNAYQNDKDYDNSVRAVSAF
ncbi:MAG: DUF1566 domain-containing protein, partial [Alistipes sp.]|nr:DUF1566 domain-containing protein [Alistipes sp.]